VLFHLAARRFKGLTRHVIPIGVIYGVVVWAVMNLIACRSATLDKARSIRPKRPSPP